MIFKCKICGGSLDVKQGERTAVCEYCGVRQTIPSFIEPKTKEIYNRANSYLMHNEFDKAENLYNQILFDNKEDADAYWNVLMCRYGVTYVKDPASGKYIPTCNRTLYQPIFNDENYQNAIKYADEKQKALFEADAKTIDGIQKGIISVSKHEKPFDIFISYKETEANGARTKDSIRAQELYDKLTAEGYKVFFSRITLEDKIGTEYEPYIYAALASSKVMITVSSSKENLESVWVKNEWSRYLSMAQKASGKTLIPLYFDMDSSALPEEFAHMPTYDMNADGFEQELIRGIKKLIPLPVMLQERKKKRNKILKRVGIAAAACAVVGVICAIPWFMKLPDYNAAMQLYYDKNYPEATWAFDGLGSYRNSKEMKEKAELSWRKSLANTTSITPNGEVQIDALYFPKRPFEINEHGKIISLSDKSSDLSSYFDNSGDPFSRYSFIDAIYEDGYTINSSAYTEAYSYEDPTYMLVNETNEYDESQWHNIVQTVPVGEITTVALRSDGKVLFQNHYDFQKHYDKFHTDTTWLNEVLSWENIIALYSDDSVLAGVRSDGKVCFVGVLGKELTYYNYGGEEFFKSAENIKKLQDVKKISIAFEPDYDSHGHSALFMNFAALTKQNKIISYIKGEYKETSVKDAIDIRLFNNDLIILSSKGNISEINNDNIILKDVVYMQNEYFVTRNGALYQINIYNYNSNIEVEKYTTKKVAVYDEWIERLS